MAGASDILLEDSSENERRRNRGETEGKGRLRRTSDLQAEEDQGAEELAAGNEPRHALAGPGDTGFHRSSEESRACRISAR